MEMTLFKQEEPKIWLKWENMVLGLITDDGVDTTLTTVPDDAKLLLGTDKHISYDRFETVLAERVFSKDRKDVNRLLATLHLKEYNLIAIAKKTRAFSLSDKLWIAFSKDEDFHTTFVAVYKEFFENRLGSSGAAVASPAGVNIKNYKFLSDSFGIEKKRLHQNSYDVENEVVCYRLAQLLGLNCCYAEMISTDYVFSKYEYEPFRDTFLSARMLVELTLNVDNYRFILDSIERNYQLAKSQTDSIIKMFIFDFITNQDDRHLSNWAFLYRNDCLLAYPMYDNGRCLFHDWKLSMIQDAVKDVESYSTSFGLVGSYYDLMFEMEELPEIISSWPKLNSLDDEEVKNIFDGLDVPEERASLCCEWIMNCVNVLRSII